MTAETRKRTFVLSLKAESASHTEGAESGDATGKDDALRIKVKVDA